MKEILSNGYIMSFMKEMVAYTDTLSKDGSCKKKHKFRPSSTEIIKEVVLVLESIKGRCVFLLVRMFCTRLTL
jgi:regulatory protein YycH of two-component signal transduction system YycFG